MNVARRFCIVFVQLEIYFKSLCSGLNIVMFEKIMNKNGREKATPKFIKTGLFVLVPAIIK